MSEFGKYVWNYFDLKFDNIRKDFNDNPYDGNTSAMGFTIGILGYTTSLGVTRYQNELTDTTD